MILRVPDYYKEFTCLAGKCKDSCCVGWEIDIDEDTWDYYHSIEGDFGERLKNHMKKGSDNCFCLDADGRCPFLNKKGLCDIILELGEESLCEVCTEYPRVTIEYGNVMEKCMAISCEEVGRLLFDRTEPIRIEETQMEETWCAEDFPETEEDGPEEKTDVFMREEDVSEVPEGFRVQKEYDPDWEDTGSSEDPDTLAGTEYLERARDTVIDILQDRSIRIEDRLKRALVYAEKVQNLYNQKQVDNLPSLPEKEEVSDKEKQDGVSDPFVCFSERTELFDGMELLDEEWKNAYADTKKSILSLSAEEYSDQIHRFSADAKRQTEYENLLVYFVFRYTMRSVYDGNFLTRIRFAALCFLMIRDMDLARYQDQKNYTVIDRIDMARIFSKEVEHSEENVDLLTDDLLFYPLKLSEI